MSFCYQISCRVAQNLNTSQEKFRCFKKLTTIQLNAEKNQICFINLTRRFVKKFKILQIRLLSILIFILYVVGGSWQWPARIS